MIPVHFWDSPRTVSIELDGFGGPGVRVAYEYEVATEIERAFVADGLEVRVQPTLARRLRLGAGTEYLVAPDPWTAASLEIAPHGPGLLLVLSATSPRQRHLSAFAWPVALVGALALLLAAVPQPVWIAGICVALVAPLPFAAILAKRGVAVDAFATAALHGRVSALVSRVVGKPPRVGQFLERSDGAGPGLPPRPPPL